MKAPTAEQLHTLLHQIIQHMMKCLTRQGYLVEEQGMTYLADTETEIAMTPLQSAACTYTSRPVSVKDTSEESDDDAPHALATRMSWARFLKRVFDIDVEHCPNCGGNLKIIAAIEEPCVIAKILTHLGFAHPSAASPSSLRPYATQSCFAWVPAQALLG